MKEKKNTVKSEKPQKMSFKDADEFHAYLRTVRADALKAVQEMSKHPVSLEEKRKQVHRIQERLRNPKN